MNTTTPTTSRGGALAALVIALAGLAACGGTPDLSCDDVQRYQQTVQGDKLRTPADLDDLDEFRELPLPKASPRPARPEGSPCLDLPPSILGKEGQ